jgi:hypothetical protein
MEEIILKVCKGSYIEMNFLINTDVSNVYNQCNNYILSNQSNKGTDFLENSDD